MTRAQRMREARLAVHLSQGKVAKLLGVSRAAIFNWETEGASKTAPATEHLVKCAKIYKKSVEWLMFGDGFSEKNEVIWPADKSQKGNLRLVYIPVITWELAKKGKLAVSELLPEHAEYIPVITDEDVSCAFALKIKNDSMIAPYPTEPSFQESDYIAINPNITNIKDGKFGVFLEKDASDPIFRKLMINGKESYLVPLNKEYNKIKMNSEIEIIGKMFFRGTPFN